MTLGGTIKPCPECGYTKTYPETIAGDDQRQIEADEWVANGCPDCGAKP